MSAFICGSELPELLKAQVLKDYAPAFRKPKDRIRWLASRGFYVTQRGALDKRHQQAWPLFKAQQDDV